MSKIKAAVLRDPKEISLEEIEIDEPRRNEVLVDIHATGVCATDYHPYAGEQEVPLPMVLGHEGAGVVEAIGEGVDTVEPGDHVVLTANLHCGKCKYCISGRPNLCPKGNEIIFSGTQMDGSTRLHSGNEKIYQFFAQSSFATKSVVPELAAVKVRENAPLDKICLLACGASTGIGAVLNTANVRAGESVTVFGCGGLGSSAVLAAKAVGAGEIIGVDIVQSKLDKILSMGATKVVNAGKEDSVDRVQELTEGGTDYAFEFTGNTGVMEQAIRSARPGGTIVLCGDAEEGSKFEVSSDEFLPGLKKIMGDQQGSSRPALDIPRYVEMYMEGIVNLDSLVTKKYRLEELDEAFSDMEKGKLIRGVVDFKK